MSDADAKPTIQARKRRRRRGRRRPSRSVPTAMREFAIAVTVTEFAGRPRQSAVGTTAILTRHLSVHLNPFAGASR